MEGWWVVGWMDGWMGGRKCSPLLGQGWAGTETACPFRHLRVHRERTKNACFVARQLSRQLISLGDMRCTKYTELFQYYSVLQDR